jgi:hypothetical protein
MVTAFEAWDVNFPTPPEFLAQGSSRKDNMMCISGERRPFRKALRDMRYFYGDPTQSTANGFIQVLHKRDARMQEYLGDSDRPRDLHPHLDFLAGKPNLTPFSLTRNRLQSSERLVVEYGFPAQNKEVWLVNSDQSESPGDPCSLASSVWRHTWMTPFTVTCVEPP